jgi:hypothetical protein
MLPRVTLLITAWLALSGCGRKEPPPPSSTTKPEKVSIENQAPPAEAPPPTPGAAPSAPASEPSAPAPANEGESDNVTQKRYNRNMEWLRALKMGDDKQKQQTAAAIKKAGLSAKERAEFEELKNHYNVQYPVQY